MSVYAYKDDKGKFNLGNESDLTGIGDGTPFGAIKALNESVAGNWTKINVNNSFANFNEILFVLKAVADDTTRNSSLYPISLVKNGIQTLEYENYEVTFTINNYTLTSITNHQYIYGECYAK